MLAAPHGIHSRPVRAAVCAAAALLAPALAYPSAAPPTRIHAVRVGPGVIGVEWTPGRGAPPTGYVLWRAEAIDGPYRTLAKRSTERPYFLDGKVEAGKLYFYKVAAFTDESRPSAQAGPTCAWDADQLVPNGSFELDPEGLLPAPSCPIWWARRAYNARTPVVIEPGGPDGTRCVRIDASNASVSGGLHSMLIPMIEGEAWSQEAWSKAMPGAKVLIGRCFYNEERKPVRGKGIRKPYDYTTAGRARRDGWRKHAGSFTAPASTCYVQLWLIGFHARNTFWLDGSRVIDETAKRVREFDWPGMKKETDQLQASAKSRALESLEGRIVAIRRRMAADLDALSPLAYRRLLVNLDKAQRELIEELWHVKTLALLRGAVSGQ